jgi:gas vesicle GvpC-like protein
VIALKDSWHEQRQQRQQEIAQRQQQVRETLAAFQQQRQQSAAQLRDDLSLFQLGLQQETQVFLAHLSDRRQIQAQQLAQELHNFHIDLSQSVASLRQELKIKVQAIQAEVQQLLETNQQRRAQIQMQLAQDLATFMESLHSEVQTYLSELELMRQDRANHLQQELEQNRAKRLAEMTALRAELRDYCTSLRTMVWGNGSDNSSELSSDGVSSVLPVADSEAIALTSSLPVEPTSQPVPVTPIPQVLSSLQKDPVQLEEEIYYHIYQVQGARLTELEAALGINRFQAVDALRALIKKGLVTQRDRVYLIQEEASL